MSEGQSVGRARLHVDEQFAAFVESEMLPGTGIAADAWWEMLENLLLNFTERNRALLHTRATLQRQIDEWHRGNPGPIGDLDAYTAFLRSIGYLAEEGQPFVISTSHVDREIAEVCGPQLVVPVMNARYALNAANARWGSLFDALYGTDALGDLPSSGPYDPARGARVIAWSMDFLDLVAPIAGVHHRDVEHYFVDHGTLSARVADRVVGLTAGTEFVGYSGAPASPSSVCIRHNGLLVRIDIDREHQVGRSVPSGVCDVVIESAITAIMDFEDSVAAVDAADKVVVYRNWLGLMTRTLVERITKNGSVFDRRLSPDWTIRDPHGERELVLRGTALMLARNVGHLMTTPAVRLPDGAEAFEGLVDLIVTATCALHDLRSTSLARNSSHNSVYVVKPKMHGPEEVRFAVDAMAHVEQQLNLESGTIKIGIMDEERRTTLNLLECIRAARERVAFINTGFLDRTGDEIHTSMEAGPMLPKAEMKSQPWLRAYEDQNVDIGLACGFPGRAQIGKGMWAAPDLMADMLRQKIAHVEAGANCAWVPSPTAATLHATHYHRVSVRQRQEALAGQRRGQLSALLTVPVGQPDSWSPEVRLREIENNCQSILGYVVRWIDLGVGCSKVPDIDHVALMEDRATCRISSQHLANWVRHGVVSRADVNDALVRMATVVDAQNADDPLYESLVTHPDGEAFSAARDLIAMGCEQPSGYTEPILHARRTKRKQRGGSR